MELSDAHLNVFDRTVLKLHPDKRKAYLEQVDYLIGRLKQKIDEDTAFGIKKFRLAGSLPKGTVLRPRDGQGVDADSAAYLDIGDATSFDLETLHYQSRRLLVAIYPQKRPEDFTVQPRTLGIHFHDSGLDVDLVPVVPIDATCDYGWQPSSQGEPPLKTSIPKQLAFIRSRKERDPRYRQLIRLLKRWRNFHELDFLRSYTIELLLAHLQDTPGPAERLEVGLLRFFLWVAQTRLTQPVSFPENGSITVYPNDPVVVLDPVNAENNVARRITLLEREEIVRQATEAWETLTTARRNGYKGETLELWKEVFGRSFVVEE